MLGYTETVKVSALKTGEPYAELTAATLLCCASSTRMTGAPRGTPVPGLGEAPRSRSRQHHGIGQIIPRSSAIIFTAL
jgi:hypothetical protein